MHIIIWFLQLVQAIYRYITRPQYNSTRVPEKAVLRSNTLEEATTSDQDTTALDFVAVGTVCAVLAPNSSPDTVNFVKITDIKYAKDDMMDEYGSTIIKRACVKEW